MDGVVGVRCFNRGVGWVSVKFRGCVGGVWVWRSRLIGLARTGARARVEHRAWEERLGTEGRGLGGLVEGGAVGIVM